jgi:hypothetical protein
MTITLKLAQASVSRAGRVSAAFALLFASAANVHAQTASSPPRVLQVGTF